MIIWLASYPRSGNSYLRLVLSNVFGFDTHEMYEWPDAHVAAHRIAKRLSDTPDGVPRAEWDTWLEKRHAAPEPWFVKTHELAAAPFPAIYLIRDGRDALVSHAHFVLHFDRRIPPAEQPRLFPETLEMLIESEDSFGGWSRHVRAWTARQAPTAVMRFADLVGNPVATTRRALETLGCPIGAMHPDRLPAFRDLRKIDAAFFRRGQVGAWRDEMPPALHARFWARHGDTMRRLGLLDGAPEGWA
jgi:hypothetical protein